MKTIETTGTVTVEGELVVRVPPSIPAGYHRVVVVIDEATQEEAPRSTLALPVHDVGPWPEDLSLRREDTYSDDAR